VRQIDSFFEDEATIPLYHYTGVGSLLGISSAESLWASSISYLNDSTEIIHACETVENVLRGRFVFGKQDEEYEFLKQFQTWTNSLKNTAHTIFVFSLSEMPSLLSQWRSYTPHGKGVSLEFSPDKINFIAQSSNLKIARCVYDRGEQEDVIGALIEKLLISFRQQLPTIDTNKCPPDQCYYDVINQYTNDIFQVLAIIKHGAFQEEREWRLISQHYPRYTDPQVKFREGASMLVPYIELQLGNSKPYFTNVILGPSPHQSLSFSGLAMFLNNKGLCGKTTNCDIPYREW
jgi:hypothetical protein